MISPSAKVLRDVYRERKSRNAGYSLRSFARDLRMEQSLLSRILAGKRKLTAVQALKAARSLQLDAGERDRLLGGPLPVYSARETGRGFFSGKYPSPEFVRLPVEFDLSWLEVAILDFTLVSGFRSDVTWMAKKLGVKVSEVSDAVERLLAKGLAEEADGELRKLHRKYYFSPDRSQARARAYHQTMIRKGLAELEKTDQAAYRRRMIQGLTFAANPARLEEAKVRITNFVQELNDFLSDGECSELYQLNLQLFPLADTKD